MDILRILFLPLSCLLFVSCGGGDSTTTADPAVTAVSSDSLRESFHGLIAEVGDKVPELSKEEAEAQVLAINPDFFSGEGVPADLDGAIATKRDQLNRMIQEDVPLPHLLHLLLKKADAGSINGEQKILLNRSLTDCIAHIAESVKE